MLTLRAKRIVGLVGAGLAVAAAAGAWLVLATPGFYARTEPIGADHPAKVLFNERVVNGVGNVLLDKSGRTPLDLVITEEMINARLAKFLEETRTRGPGSARVPARRDFAEATPGSPRRVACGDAPGLMLRRGRGYAPRPIALAVEAPETLLAVGPELKNAVCLVRASEAFVSQHIGDLKHPLAADYFEKTVEKMERLLEIRPKVLAHDLHPAYYSTRYARRRAEEEGLRLVGVQHHHAHIASVMAEHGLEGDLIGLAMDGTGYGTDGTVWGGEILRASPARFERLGHLACVALPGGDAAVEHPVRTAWAFLLEAYGPEEAERRLVGRLAETRSKDRRIWADMVAKGVSAPRACGLGRLFDAASVLAGVSAENTYEGQAAIELEAAAGDADDDVPPYAFAIADAPAGGGGWVIDTVPIIRGVVADVEAGLDAAFISARFHASVAAMLRAAARRAREETKLERIALTGGCFANARLARLLAAALEADGFEVYLHRDV
ncbi:MAG: hypothetical protein NTX40_10760, partial [Planctomycetota bacterium]|nr:hypothetical protein [Planctomycetota bacterium]